MTNLAANLHPRSSDDASSLLFPHARPAVHRIASQQLRMATSTHVNTISPSCRSNRLRVDDTDYANHGRAGGR